MKGQIIEQVNVGIAAKYPDVVILYPYLSFKNLFKIALKEDTCP